MKKILLACLLLLPCISRGAPGDILSVNVLTNGWQADIVIEGLNIGGVYNFGLGTNNAPELGNPTFVITSTSLSFNDAGSATTKQREIFGTYFLQRPWPDDAIREELFSGGNTRIRVSLSDYVFEKDTPVTASALSGLYTQSGTPNNAVSGVSVVNNSIVQYKRPVVAWSEPGRNLITGPTFKVSAVAFHINAEDGKQVRLVRFIATQGAVSNVVDVINPTIDHEKRDQVPVIEYIGEMSSAPFDQNAVVTVNFRVFPLMGDADSVLFSGDGANSGSTPNYAPQFWVCDKNGTYGRSVARVSTSGNDATGVVVFLPNYNESSPPLAFQTIAQAASAIHTNNNTQLGRGNVGGGIVYLEAGSHTWLGGSQSYGATPDTWITIRPAPGVSRDDVIISGASGNSDISDRIKLENIKITSTATTFTGIQELWLDGCEIDSAAGSSVFNVNTLWYLTRNLFTRSSQGIRPVNTVNSSPAIVRGNRIVQMAAGSAGNAVAYTFIGNHSVSPEMGINNLTSGQTAPAAQMPIVAFNKLFKINKPTATAMTFSKHTDIIGAALVQNVFEKTTDNVAALSFMFSEGGNFTTMDNFIMAHNSFVGQRSGHFYNWESAFGYFENMTLINNVISAYGGKTDTDVPESSDNTQNWGTIYGVNWKGNMDGAIAGVMAAGGFRNRFWGLNAHQKPTSGTYPTNFYLFKRHGEVMGGNNNIGEGDYRLRTNSPLRGLSKHWILPYDLEGAPRVADKETAGPYGHHSYYHVAKHGSDFTGDGSWSRPWLTIQHGINNSTMPNDTVFVWGGTYAENIVSVSDGTTEFPITIRGRPGQSIVVSGVSITNVNVVIANIDSGSGPVSPVVPGLLTTPIFITETLRIR